MDDVLIDQVSRLLAHETTDARLRASRAGGRADGWDAITAAGLPLALACEAAGGLALDAATVLAIARAHGKAGAPWPLAEAMIDAAPECPAELWAPALATAEIAGLDPARFGPQAADRAWLVERAREVYASYYSLSSRGATYGCATTPSST